MKLEDMKYKIPSTPDFIHEMIHDEVDRQLRQSKTIDFPSGKKRKWSRTSVAAMVAAFGLALSTAAYAGVQLYHLFTEKRGTYGIATGLQTADTKNITLPEEVHDIRITTGYIPEGMEWTDESHLQYSDSKQRGGFSFSSELIDQDALNHLIKDDNVVKYEKRSFGGYEGVYLQYHDLKINKDSRIFNQRIYLLCPEEYRIITIFIGNDVSKEDAFKVADHLVITETDKMIKTADMYSWSDVTSDEETESEAPVISEDQLPVLQVGKTFEISSVGISSGDELEECTASACVDSVKLSDDLHLLSQDRIPEAWKTVVDADGRIKDNTLYYIQSGNGIDTVDKVIKTESVKQKLVYVTVTYTNNTDRELRHILYCGTLMLLDHKGGQYQITDPAKLSGTDCDYVNWDGVSNTETMAYSDVSEDYGNGGNYIPSLAPGKSIQIHMAWIVNENLLDHLYLNLNGDCNAYAFSDTLTKSGVVDIRPAVPLS